MSLAKWTSLILGLLFAVPYYGPGYSNESRGLDQLIVVGQEVRPACPNPTALDVARKLRTPLRHAVIKRINAADANVDMALACAIVDRMLVDQKMSDAFIDFLRQAAAKEGVGVRDLLAALIVLKGWEKEIGR